MDGLPVLTHEKSGSLVLRSNDPFALRELIPQSKTLRHPDFNFACQWTDTAVKLLRNAGFDAPLRPRTWPGIYQPRPHQLETIEFHMRHPRHFDLSDPGVGKTFAALWAADEMMKQNRIKKMVVLCPLSTVATIWQDACYKLLLHRHVSVVHGDETQRRRALNAPADIYIVNHDGIKIRWLRDELRQRRDIDLWVVDEGGMFRDYKRNKYKALYLILQGNQKVWWLTGTPTPNGPEDAWSQCRIINPNNVPKYITHWRYHTMIPNADGKLVPRKNAKDLVYAAMQPAIRFSRDEVNKHLPAMGNPIDLQAQMTPEQAAAVKQMRRKMGMDLASGTVTAINAADAISKIRQALLGSVFHAEQGIYVDVDFAPRLSVLLEAIEMAKAKVIVVVPFKGILWRLKTELEKHGLSVGVLNGDIPIKERNATIIAFKTTRDPHILLCHPKVMAHGLNLTEADTTILYGPFYSADEFEQVIQRMNREGQKHVMNVIRIASHPIEWRIYGMVADKRKSQADVLDLYRKIAANEELALAA